MAPRKATRKADKTEPGKGAGHLIVPLPVGYRSRLSRPVLIDVHSALARVSGSVVLAFKHGATDDEIEQWKKDLKQVLGLMS